MHAAFKLDPSASGRPKATSTQSKAPAAARFISTRPTGARDADAIGPEEERSARFTAQHVL